jgi:hypothetical protein
MGALNEAMEESLTKSNNEGKEKEKKEEKKKEEEEVSTPPDIRIRRRIFVQRVNKEMDEIQRYKQKLEVLVQGGFAGEMEVKSGFYFFNHIGSFEESFLINMENIYFTHKEGCNAIQLISRGAIDISVTPDCRGTEFETSLTRLQKVVQHLRIIYNKNVVA